MQVAKEPNFVVFVAPPGLGKSVHIEALKQLWPGRVLVASVPALIRGTPEVVRRLNARESDALDGMRGAAWAAAARGDLAPREFDRILIDLLARIRDVDVILLDAFPRDRAVAKAYAARGLAVHTTVVRLGCPAGVDEATLSRARQFERDVSELGLDQAQANAIVHQYRAQLFQDQTALVVPELTRRGASLVEVHTTTPFIDVHGAIVAGLRDVGALPLEVHAPVIVDLREAAALPRTIVGAKAQALGRLASHGLNVPRGVVLTTVFHERALRACGLLDVLGVTWAQVRSQPASGSSVLARARRQILDAELPEMHRTMIKTVTRHLLSDGPVAVRSSAPGEDGARLSHAGVFHSELDVADAVGVEDGLRRCWAGLLTDRAAFYLGASSQHADLTAVVVQEQVVAEWAGVGFTVDPVSGRSGGVLVEATLYDTTAVTKGQQVDVRAHLPDPASRLPGRLTIELLRTAEAMRRLFQADAEFEWAFDGEELFVLQARLVSTRSPASVGIANQEDVAAVRALVLGRVEHLFARAMQKKVWLRRTCQAAGIPVFPIVYAVYDPARAHDSAEAIRASVDSATIILDWGDGPKRCASAHLTEVLRAEAGRNKVGNGLAAVQAGALIAAQFVGFSSCTADDGVMIELLPAGVPGFKSGKLRPTVYHVAADGSVDERVAETTMTASLDRKTAVWHISRHSPVSMVLGSDLISEVARQTRIVAKAHGEARYEFYVSDGSVISKDMTLESSVLHAVHDEPTVLSRGWACGRLLRIHDVDALEELGDRHNISVFAHSADDAVLSDPVASAFLDGLRGLEPVVVWAPYPSVGLIPFARKVAGFAFSQGSVLGHTAIVLRELGVPAVVTSLAEDLRDGDLVQVSPSGVKRLEVTP